MARRPPGPTAMNDSDPPAEEIHAARAERAPPRYSSEQLFEGARQLVIVHGGREYSLRLTATNKLILTA